MPKTLSALWLSLAALSVAARADSLWTRRYDGPSSCTHNAAFSVLPDPARGIVYFCGMGESDYPLHTDILVGAYGFDGRLIDATSIGGWTGGADFGHALSLDSVGLLFVCGATDHPGSRSWEFTWARYDYDPLGDSLVGTWTNKSFWPGPDAAYHVACGPGGELYVCGASAPDTLNPYRSYLVVARIDASDASVRWTRRLSPDSSAGARPRPLPDPELPFDLLNWDCYGAKLALDAAGNIIVAGAGYVPGSGHEAWLARLDTAGNVLAQTLWHASVGDLDDALFDIAIAPDGSVYACGLSETEDGDVKALVLCADTALRVTASRLFGPTGEPVEAWASRVRIDDATGDVFVTGGADDGDRFWQMMTQRFSPALAPRWPEPGALLGGPEDDRGVDITVRDGFAFVTGELDCALTVVCYGAGPAPLWTWRYDSPDSLGAIGASIACCGDSALFVGGSADRGAGEWSSLVLARLDAGSGLAEALPCLGRSTPAATVVCGVLNLTSDIVLLDAAGRRVLSLAPGPNDVSRLAPGVYFVCPSSSGMRGESSTSKVVVSR